MGASLHASVHTACSLACTAQIRLMENGTFVHRESQTYRRKVLANEWLLRREYEMDQEHASCQAVHKKISVGEPLRDYVSAAENVTEWGRSKKADIARLQASGRAAYRSPSSRCRI